MSNYTNHSSSEKPRKMMPFRCFSSRHRPPPPPPPPPSPATLLEASISAAEPRQLLRTVADLHSAMASFASDPAAGSRDPVQAQILMQAAMRRLESELHRILAAGDDGEQLDTCAAADLRAIADAMITAGYGKECAGVYTAVRKSAVDEGLSRLGFQRLTFSQVRRLDWEAVLEPKIESWLRAARVATKTLFAGERSLVDRVFAGSDSIRESCFANTATDAAVHFFAFPEFVAKTKTSPEKMFLMLDLYDAITDLWPEIEKVFAFDSTAAVRSQALSSLLNLAEAVRRMLAKFEAVVRKDASKSPVLGGGVHPLAQYAINYIACLANYDQALTEIYTEFPLQLETPLPESFFASPHSISSSSISVRLAWLVLVLLCKLDGKAEVYKDVPLAYLFLANNLQYIVNKAHESRLGVLLGEDWVARHAAKARHYAGNYECLSEMTALIVTEGKI